MNNKWVPEVGQRCNAVSVTAGEILLSNFAFAAHQMNLFFGVKDGKGISIPDTYCRLEPAQSEADKYRDEQIERLWATKNDSNHVINRSQAVDLYEAGCRILAPDERVAKRLTEEHKSILRRFFKTQAMPYAAPMQAVDDLIDAVQNAIFGGK